MRESFKNLQIFVYLLTEYLITLLIRKILRIFIIIIFIFYCSGSVYASYPDSIVGIIHYNLKVFLNEEILQTNESKIYNEFEYKFHEMYVNHEDRLKIKQFFYGATKLEDLSYDKENKEDIPLKDIVRFSKMLIDTSDTINIDSINKLIKNYNTGKTDPFETLYKMFIVMDKYIEIEKQIIRIINPPLYKALLDITPTTLGESIKKIKDYKEFEAEFAKENNFELVEFGNKFQGIKGMLNYKEFQIEVATNLGLEYKEEDFKMLDALLKYGKIQEEYQDY